VACLISILIAESVKTKSLRRMIGTDRQLDR
jgi:hypothetical protein